MFYKVVYSICLRLDVGLWFKMDEFFLKFNIMLKLLCSILENCLCLG